MNRSESIRTKGWSLFALLPDGDAEWVVSTAVATMVPILGPGAEAIGVVAVGRRFDDRRLSVVDLDFLQALAAGVGLALGRVRLADTPTGRAADAPPARECATCGIVASAHSARLCGCGADYAAAPVPAMLAGKFSIERRVGSGAMGTVYLARDVGLQRQVAVKTLPVGDGPGLVRLTQEARAMAAVAHPAIAQIHGLETWRGRPLLVVEFLHGGTLAARLDRGPLPSAEAVGVAAALSAALTALHDAGYVHGDVKPSNIGFASDGTAKLLDFGLARLTNDHDQPAGGTLSYMSPEVLCGGRAGEADDVWSLCVVLYEMVAGRRPFIGDGVDGGSRLHPTATDPSGRGRGGTDGTGGFSECSEVDRVRRFDPDGWTIGATPDGTCVRRCVARTLSPCTLVCSVRSSSAFTQLEEGSLLHLGMVPRRTGSSLTGSTLHSRRSVVSCRSHRFWRGGPDDSRRGYCGRGAPPVYGGFQEGIELSWLTDCQGSRRNRRALESELGGVLPQEPRNGWTHVAWFRR